MPCRARGSRARRHSERACPGSGTGGAPRPSSPGPTPRRPCEGAGTRALRARATLLRRAGPSAARRGFEDIEEREVALVRERLEGERARALSRSCVGKSPSVSAAVRSGCSSRPISSQRCASSTSRSRRGPSAPPPSHFSSARSGSDHSWSSTGRAARKTARARRAATRSRWTSSASRSSRTPTSWRRISLAVEHRAQAPDRILRRFLLGADQREDASMHATVPEGKSFRCVETSSTSAVSLSGPSGRRKRTTGSASDPRSSPTSERAMRDGGEVGPPGCSSSAWLPSSRGSSSRQMPLPFCRRLESVAPARIRRRPLTS
jgi:hypothetical protein